jgi:DNA-binding transcriptional LysR family regulator
VRRIVHDYVLAALDRQKPQLEHHIADRLVYPESSHRVLTDPAASIREIRRLKIAPRFRADYPPVDVTVVMRVAMTAHTRDRGADIGIRTTAVDVELRAVGTAQGMGYNLEPQTARLVACWGDA